MDSTNTNKELDRIGAECKNLMEQFIKGVDSKVSQELLDNVVKLTSEYIAEGPNVSVAPLCEQYCLNRIEALFNSNGMNKTTSIFIEQYMRASSGVRNQCQRDLISSLILFNLESDLLGDDSSEIKSNESENNGVKVLMPGPSGPFPLSRSSSSTYSSALSIGSCFSLTEKSSSNNKLVGPIEPRSYDSSQTTVGLGYNPAPNYMVELYRQKNVDEAHDIVQNAVYSFIGIQCKYLKKDVITGRFKLDPGNRKYLAEPQCGMLIRLSELGYYHDRVAKFSNTSTGYNAMGCMGQAFMSKLKEELSDFHGKVAQLQDDLNEQRQSALQYYGGVQLSLPCNKPKLTLIKLIDWYVEPLARMQWLTKIANACLLKKGGELLSVLYDFLEHGDPGVNELAGELLTACCSPLVRMISKWMLEGGIDDSFGEFFVESLADVGVDRLWHDKFRLRLSMLPKFISHELADKILKTGKSINFLREVCKEEGAVEGRKTLKETIENNVPCIFSYVPDTVWHAALETCYTQTSQHVLDIMVGPHKLLEHLRGMRRYLLLGQGDFVTIFIEHMKDELEKPGTEIYSHDLSSILDAALRCTNAQFDDAEILNHLDVVVKTPFPGDCGWDVISLQYTVRGPLATMLEPAMPTYKSLFKPLWRIKHMDFLLSTKIWKSQMENAKALRSMSGEINKVTYRLNLFTSEIMHFVHQMQYYVLFEVIECNWVELHKSVQQATALDEILDAHSKFLDAISVGCFVDSSKGMENYLEVVYENIILLESWQCKFYKDCHNELASRKKMAKAIADSEKAGDFGLTAEQKIERDQERKIFEQKLMSSYRSFETFALSYGKAVGEFLLALNFSDDHNLQLFATRLDFNEYYKKRDNSLSKPLTFEHWRLSNVFGTTKPAAGRHTILPTISRE